MATRGRGVDQIRSFISDGLRVGYLYFMNPNFVIEYCWHESQGKAKYVSASPSISPEIISSCTTFARIPELHWSRPIHSMPIYDRQRSSTAKMPMILHLANRAYLGKKKKKESPNEAVQTLEPTTENGSGHFYLMALVHQGDPSSSRLPHSNCRSAPFKGWRFWLDLWLVNGDWL